MLMIYLWFYTLVLALLWWLFTIAKIHSYKFKNFSKSILRVTNTLIAYLIILSISWYVLIFMSLSNTTTNVSDFSSFDSKEVNY